MRRNKRRTRNYAGRECAECLNLGIATVKPGGRPTLVLVDPGGATYRADVPATSVVSNRALLRGAVASSVNPGIVMRVTNVFEVPKDAAGKPGWQALITADKKVVVNLDK